MANEKFTIVDLKAISEGSHFVLLSDYKFWSNEYENLKKWCKENCLYEFKITGMILTFHNEKDLIQFILYWG